MPAASVARMVRPHRPLARAVAENGDVQSSNVPSEGLASSEEEEEELPGAASSLRRHCVLATPLPASEAANVALKLPSFEARGGESVGAGTSGGRVSTTNENAEGDDDDDDDDGVVVEVVEVVGGETLGDVLPTASVATTEKKYEPSGSEE